ncbi:Regulator of chromosome condensation [Sparganum proliferum]
MVYRGKRRQNEASNISFTKRRKVESQAETGIVSELRQRNERKFETCGTVLTLGSGDTGQLGLGPDITERSKPSRFSAESLRTAGLDDESSESFVQVAAGGMHTVCLTSDGRVFTFGCNDEGALGRTSKDASDEEDGNEAEKSDEEAQPTAVLESRPGLVTFPEPVTIRKVTAGDSHSAALDDDGRVWLWGTFRGSSGVLGLTKASEICRSPVLLNMPSDVCRVVKIASGQDHLVLLTEDGRLFTMGCGEQGQLGRIAERFAKDGGRNGLDLLLQPAECRLRGAVRFLDVWAGGFATIARSLPSGVIYACGLNNYGQLALVPATGATRLEAEKPQTASEPAAVEAEGNAAGTEVSPQTLSESMLLKKQGPLVQFMLTPALGFDPSKDWQQFAISMHHTIALTASGEVYAVGRSDYGRLGFPVPSSVDSSAVPLPHLVQGGLAGRECQWVACGESCSFAVDNKGVAFSWGMGSSQQLAQAEEDEDVPEPAPMLGKNLANRKTLMIDAGGQHTVLLAQDPSRNPPLADSKESTQKEVISASEPGPMDVSEDSEVLSKLPKEITQEDAGDQAHLISDGVSMAKIPKLDSDYKESPPADDIELAQPIATTGKVEILTPSDLLTSVTSTLPIDVRSVDSSALASTAGATVNTSSLRSCSITSSSQPPSCDAVSSCSSNASAESGVVSSTHSTDGGGSSRLSSLGGASVQSSLLAAAAAAAAAATAAGGGSGGQEVESTRQPDETRRPGPPRGFPVQAAAATTRGVCGMSICSTSSEPGGFPTDTTTSLGSVTASPIDMTNGETGAGGAV